MRFLWLLLAPFRILWRLLVRPFRLRARRRVLKAHGWVELHLEGAIQELRTPSKIPPFIRRFLRREDEPRVVLSRLRKFADELIADPYAKGVLVRLGMLGGGWASAMRVKEELDRIARADKQLIVHIASHAGNRELLIAMSASRLYATPTGVIAATGTAATSLYLKDTLAQAGVRFEVAKRGRYKAAPEQLSRSDRSVYDREQTQALVDAVDGALVQAVMQGRRVDRAGAEEMLDRAPMVGQVALELRSLDGVARDEDLPEHVRTAAGAEKAVKLVGAGTYLGLRDLAPIVARKRKQVGVVEVHGAIVERGSPYAPYFGKLAVERAIVNDLRAALESPSIGAVILHVDSRGGSVAASDAIYAAVARLEREKPVIACFGDVSASGGYYVACGARAIVCAPLTVTGSIGVFAMYPTWPELGVRFGVHHDVVKNRKNAALFEPWAEFTEEARQHADAEVGAMYETFLQLVAAARKKTRDEVHAIAEGHIWMGQAAYERGLVDGLGGMVEAVARAKEAAGGRFEEDPVLVKSRRHHARPDAHEPKDKDKGQLGMVAELILGGAGGVIASELIMLALTSSRSLPLLAYEPLELR